MQIYGNHKGSKTLRKNKRATFPHKILFSISRDHLENVSPEIIQKKKGKVTIITSKVTSIESS